jgi:tetratricopeptide (TPR) repeat protein
MLRDALAARPADADALYLRGVIANRRRDPGAAIALLRQAVAAPAATAPAWHALGNAYAQAGEPALAADAFREAVARRPEWVDARHNLGLMLKRLGDLPAAARMFYAAWRLDPALPEAAQQCVDTLAAWVRGDRGVPLPAPVPLPATPPSVGVVVCSIDPAKRQRVEALYRRVLAAVRHEVTVIGDARSLAEAYNRAIRDAACDVIVLSHDDVDILAPDFAARLLGHLAHFDAVGVAGGLRLAGPAPGWGGHPQLRGWITHREAAAPGWRAGVLHPDPVAGGIAVLDGVLLAGRRELFAAVPFDAGTFDGFHLYDVDWSVRAAAAGFRLAAAGDLLLVHHSRGRYDERWRVYADRFCAKHALAGVPPSAERTFFEAAFDTADEVRAFYARLGGLAG